MIRSKAQNVNIDKDLNHSVFPRTFANLSMRIPAPVALTDPLIYLSSRVPTAALQALDAIADQQMKTRSALVRDILLDFLEGQRLIRRRVAQEITNGR